jgi:hypothetical protein
MRKFVGVPRGTFGPRILGASIVWTPATKTQLSACTIQITRLLRHDNVLALDENRPNLKERIRKGNYLIFQRYPEIFGITGHIIQLKISRRTLLFSLKQITH